MTGASNSAHSDRWRGPSSRGQRLTRKLGGERIVLARLEALLRGTPR